MENLKMLLTGLASGESIEGTWKKAGYSSIKGARKALLDLARSIGPGVESARPGGKERDTRDKLPSLGKGEIVVFTDGASRGNPGPASAAAVAYLPSGEELTSRAVTIGVATNNEAEYRAVIVGLELAGDLGAKDVTLKLDSELVVKQLNAQYRIKKRELIELARIAGKMSSRFDRCRYEHVRREDNREADKLANNALDNLRE